jgi:hypothetical protein
MKYSILFLILLFLFINPVNAQNILSTNSTGGEQNTFYSNESVYTMSTVNITTNSTIVRIYIVSDNNSWTNGTTLTDASTGYRTATTNDTGYLTNTRIWSPTLTIGKYDIVVDANNDGKYNTTFDFVDNLTITGFEVIAVPKPSIVASRGEQSPSNHDWDLANGDANNLMFQLKLTAGSVEDVKITDVFIEASGTGNDKTEIKSVTLVHDTNNNGIFDSNENILGLDAFDRDNGVIDFSLNDFILRTNSSTNLIFIYRMSNSSSNGETFSFQLTFITAEGVNSKEIAEINGLPISSAMTTIIANPTTTTILSTTTTVPSNATTTTVISITTTTQSTTTTTLPQEIPNFIDTIFDFLKSNWILVLVLIVIPLILAIVISKILKRKSEMTYEQLRKKWAK